MIDKRLFLYLEVIYEIKSIVKIDSRMLMMALLLEEKSLKTTTGDLIKIF
jgi:hypothetical protein